MSMALVERIVKSGRNRARVGLMRARGFLTRSLLTFAVDGGRNLMVGRNVDIVLYGELQIGAGVILADGCMLEIGPHGRLVIGDGVFIGRHTVVVAAEHIELGDRSLIAEHCSIRDQDHQVDPEKRLYETVGHTGPIILEPNVWLGAGVRVLRGSRIGRGSVIAANAVVRGEVPAGVVAGGLPARVLRQASGVAVERSP
jgi:hypothetical protein